MRIYWDTNLFAYLVQGNSPFRDSVKRCAITAAERGDEIGTSIFTIGELLVPSYAQPQFDEGDPIRNLVKSGRFAVLPFSMSVVERFAQVRASFRVSAPDAIHIATALDYEADVLFTNDKKLQKLRVSGLPIRSLEQFS